MCDETLTKQPHTQAYTHMCTQRDTHTYTCTHTTHTGTDMHAHTHTCTHGTDTHAHTHTHAHTGQTHMHTRTHAQKDTHKDTEVGI